MRSFKLRSTDPLFNEESLQLLKTMQAGYDPALSAELQEYLDSQAQFIVSVAKQYRTDVVGWPGLLAAGQLAFVKAWQKHVAEQKPIDRMVSISVREAILAAATAQFAVPASAESPYRWALDAGEREDMALAFAAFYADEVAEYTRQMNEQIAGIKAKAAKNGTSEIELQEDIEGVKAEIAEIEPTVLGWAWAYLEKYKSALAAGHSPEWSDTYARHFGSNEDEAAAEREAYDEQGLKHPNPKTETPNPAPGANPYPMEGWVNKAVYQEAYAVQLDRGADYADAYARTVGLGGYDAADAYAEAYVEMLRAGKSALFANYYADEVSDNKDPKYALLEAELYEQALADGMNEAWARQYADLLSTNLIEYAETEEDKEYYTQEAAEYIAKKQRDALDARAAREARAD